MTMDPATPVPPWVEITPPPAPEPAPARTSWWLIALEKIFATIVVLGLIATGGAVAARAAADRDAIAEAMGLSDLFVRTALQPVLSDDVLSSSPDARSAAIARIDDAVHAALRGAVLMRVKLWTAEGWVVYSDEPRLIGQRFALDEAERRALHQMAPIASISDLAEEENQFERSAGQLLEVYHPVLTPAGAALLVETYTAYNHVGARTAQILIWFAAITIVGLLLTHLLYAPLNWSLSRRLRRLQRRLDTLATSAPSATDEERRRIAGALHDGVVQDLAATSFMVAGSADHARGSGHPQLAARLDLAAAGVRASISALRSLLVDIYPPNLRAAGLPAVLEDLARALRNRGIMTMVVTDGDLEVDPAVQLLVYRVAQECLRNTDRHSQATRAVVWLRHDGVRLRLEVADDGVGFDPTAALDAPAPGHFGVRIMRDLVAGEGARLAVRSAPGAGTRWRLEVPTVVV
jgi:signal transduction histidine kinase